MPQAADKLPNHDIGGVAVSLYVGEKKKEAGIEDVAVTATKWEQFSEDVPISASSTSP